MRAVLARAWHGLVLLGFVLRELVVDTGVLVLALLNPRHTFRPHLIDVPLRDHSERGIAVLATLVTLSSPRQFSVGVETQPPKLTVYVLDAGDAASARADVHRLETLFLRAVGSPARFDDPPKAVE